MCWSVCLCDITRLYILHCTCHFGSCSCSNAQNQLCLSVVCLSVCLCREADLCIAGVLSGICFWRRCWTSAQFPAEIPRPGFSLHALTHGGERAHHGPFRCSAEAFLPNPTPAQHAPGRVLLPCGFISIMVTTYGPCDWRPACTLRVMCTKTKAQTLP